MRVAAALLLAVLAPAVVTRPIETLQATGGLPAHVAGRFTDLTDCAQTPAGEYFVFDRRSHAVSSVPPPYDAVRELVRIGAESGRILRPNAFALAADGSFVVADVPQDRARIQVFLTSGAGVGAFTLPTREVPTILMDDLVLTGLGSLAYTGQSILVSQPETGALVSEYGLDGRSVRSFGALRATGQEADREVHLALNAGLPVIDPSGGYYFVFLSGVPMFRKYGADGRLLFERHVEGAEIDDYIRSMPGRWPRKRWPDGEELPVLRPAVRAAAADAKGNLWISLTAPVSYVYDGAGDKVRAVEFRAAGVIAPRSFFFTADGRLLVTPGCYAFSPSASAKGAAPAKNLAAPGRTR